MRALGFSSIYSNGPFIINDVIVAESSTWSLSQFNYKPKYDQYLHLEVLDDICYIDLSYVVSPGGRYEFLPHTHHWLIKTKTTKSNQQHLCQWIIPVSEHEIMEFRLVYECGM